LICLISIVYALDYDGKGYTGAVFAMVFSFYWTTQVIRNLLHMTVAGVVGNWFYYTDANMAPSPTWNSFKRASTWSLGSVAFGSLLVAVIETLKFIADQMIKNACLKCIVDCLCSCILDLLQYFNFYAYIFCALYGDTFCEAGGKVWGIVKDNEFWSRIVNDDLIGYVCFFGAIIGGLETGLLAGGIAYGAFSSSYWLTWGFIGFLVGFAVAFCAMTVIQSAVSTLYLCYTSFPGQLQRSRPAESQALNTALLDRNLRGNNDCCAC